MKTKRPQLPVVPIIMGLLLVAAVVFGGYYYKQYQDLKAESSKTADERNKDTVAKINLVYELPKDEEPVVAIVSDEEKFKSEYPVFTSAKKGDTLLLYEKAGQAILYRESDNRVIGTATFAVKNGSSIHIIGSVDAQNSTEQQLLSKFADAVRVSGKSTPNGQYTATTVVDLTGQKADLSKQIADTLGGTVVTTLPAGEKPADGAEIVVILANSAGTATDSTSAPNE